MIVRHFYVLNQLDISCIFHIISIRTNFAAGSKRCGLNFRAEWNINMAADTSESTAEKLTFTCASCGFECNYEYFGKKPPFSKSVVYVYYFFVRGFLFFCCRTLFPRVTTQFARSLTRQSIRSFKKPLRETPRAFKLIFLTISMLNDYQPT